MESKQKVRAFFRCQTCLTVFAAEWDDLRGYRECAASLRCGICGGKVWNLGKVEGNRLTFLSHATPCDARCTSAMGPKCDCECGGKNHGTGRVVEVKRDAGGVPRASVLRSDEAKARKRAAEFQEALERVNTALERFYGYDLERYRRREWISDRSRWEDIRADLSDLSRAKGYKTHKSRMKALKELEARLTPSSS